MQRYRVFLFVFFSIISTLMYAQKKKQPLNFKKFEYKTKTDTLPYAILTPSANSPGEKLPLLIYLHGKGERGTDNEQQLKHLQILINENNFQKYPCIIFAPQCPKKYYWSPLISDKKLSPKPNAPLQMVIDMMKKVIREYPVDTTRIYVTGVSMGGFATWELITRFPNQFAAAVPVCGGGDDSAVDKIKDIPIWAFHGALDNVVPPARSRVMVQAIQAAGGHPGYTEYPDTDHNSWNFAYKEPRLMHWLFKQKRQ